MDSSGGCCNPRNKINIDHKFNFTKSEGLISIYEVYKAVQGTHCCKLVLSPPLATDASGPAYIQSQRTEEPRMLFTFPLHPKHRIKTTVNYRMSLVLNALFFYSKKLEHLVGLFFLPTGRNWLWRWEAGRILLAGHDLLL